MVSPQNTTVGFTYAGRLNCSSNQQTSIAKLAVDKVGADTNVI